MWFKSNRHPVSDKTKKSGLLQIANGCNTADVYSKIIKSDRLDQVEAYLFAGFASLAVIPVLYILRFLDNNTLTSWRWVFTDVSLGLFFLCLVPLIMAALWCSRLTFPERYSSLFLFSSGFLTSSFLWSEPEVLLDASRYFLEAKYLKMYGPGFFLERVGASHCALDGSAAGPLSLWHAFQAVR